MEILWLLVLVLILVPAIQRYILLDRRSRCLRRLEQSRGSRVITLIHRQEAMSVLGIPIARYIDIDDSEAVLNAIRLTPNSVPIDLLLHTPGGLMLASEQIAQALKKHPARVSVIVPHFAMSGGMLVALAADEILLDPNAVLGPVDPQVGEYPAASILAAVEQPNTNREDRTLILADIAQKALRQARETVLELLRERMPEEQAERVADALTQGYWTHDYPISGETARAMGLPVSDQIPEGAYELMSLYPQPMQQRPSVEYIPVPYAPAPKPEGRPTPRDR